MDLQEAVFEKEAFREEIMTQKLKQARLEEKKPRDIGDSLETEGQKGMVPAKDVETQKLGPQLQKY